MKKLLILTLLLLFFSTSVFAGHDKPPPFEELVGGKLDPNIGLLRDSGITIIQQHSIIIDGDTTKREKVIVEYLHDTPVSGKTIDLEWDGYKSKIREEEIGLEQLKNLASRDDVLAIWAREETEIFESCDKSCSWGAGGPTSLELWEDHNIDKIWTQGYEGQDIYVMVVDTGVDPSAHVKIDGRLTKNKDYHTTKHGTKSASTIASYDTNYPGVAPQATIIDCPAIEGGSYSINHCFDWAIDLYETEGHPQIISNSWGFIHPTSQNYPTVRKIKEAAEKGIVVIMAATNCGGGDGNCQGSGCCGEQSGGKCVSPDIYRGSGKSIHGPNQLQQVVTVAAFDAENLKREGYSSQGPSYASGGDYVSEKPDISGFADFRVKYGDTIKNYAGTSAATPVIAGIVALMISSNPSISEQQVKNNLYSTVYYPDSCEGDCYDDVGRGIVSPYEAVQLSIGAPPYCGDTICQANENEFTCVEDCDHIIMCGDKVCEGQENTGNCPNDCPSLCEGLSCNDYKICTQDKCRVVGGVAGCYFSPISPCCGNGICEDGEGIWGCAADCDHWQCSENCEFQPQGMGIVQKNGANMCQPICSDYCGDGICGVYETYKTCDDCPEPEKEDFSIWIIVAMVMVVMLGLLTMMIMRKKNSGGRIGWR